jgi:hypothetical protein
MAKNDPKLTKIRKLLAKAEDPATTPAEAELYTAKATDLIAEHGIDQALLAHDHHDRDAVSSRVIVMDRPFAADKADLLGAVALQLRCACVRRTHRENGVREISMHVFGHDSDLMRLEMLFTSLLVQATTAMALVPVPAWEHKAAFRRSWMAGVRRAIQHRMAEAERRARAAADSHRSQNQASTELVLAGREVEVRDAMNEAYPRLSTGRPRSLSGSGGPAGYEAGQQADLGGVRLGGGHQSVLPG